jgi:hypothetical protein
LDGINLPSYLELRERIVDLGEVPEKGQVVLALRAFGLSYGHIAKLCDTDVSMVRRLLNRYDPDGACTVSADGKRAITSQMLMSGAMAALMYVTPEKLAVSDASELAGIAQKMVMTAEKIREVDKAGKEGREKMKQVLDYLDEPVESAE